VLPLRACRPAQEVGGARLGHEVDPLPFSVADRASETEHAGREQRQPDDLAEHRLVAVPSDGRARAILCDEYVLKRVGIQLGELAGGRAELTEERGNVVNPVEAARGKVVVPAEGNNAALSRVAVELEVPEWQLADSIEQRGFVGGRDQFWPVAEAFREGRPASRPDVITVEELKLTFHGFPWARSPEERC